MDLLIDFIIAKNAEKRIECVIKRLKLKEINCNMLNSLVKIAKSTVLKKLFKMTMLVNIDDFLHQEFIGLSK